MPLWRSHFIMGLRFPNIVPTPYATLCQHGFPHLWNYIDDFIYTTLPSKIYPSYQFLLDLLPQLGLDVSKEKLVAPASSSHIFGHTN